MLDMLKYLNLKTNFLRQFDQVTRSQTSYLGYTSHIFFTKPSKMSVNEETTKNAAQEQKHEKHPTKSKLELKEERKKALKQRRLLRKENKEVGFPNDILKQTEYYFENGLRKVYPYFFGWNTTAKERWFGRTLLDIYKSEFSRATVNQSIQHLIETGKIRCNGQIKPLDYKIKNGDRISHIKHRHEIPVLADKIKIIHEDENFLVVDKPCSIPIHPCGKYRYNSLSIILTKEMGYSNLRTMYRLDRLTSGLVILGKNLQSGLLVDKHIKERTAIKTYLCRVAGEFPAEKVIVNKPLDCASKKIGLYWVDEEKGKESLTEFERVSYNGKSSVVKCRPKTGRTHQIRIHLQYLGYPIVNDPLYNQPTVWGRTNGKGGVYEYSKEVLEQNFLRVHTYEAWIIKQENSENENSEEKEDGLVEGTLDKKEENILPEENKEPELKRKLEDEHNNEEPEVKKNKSEELEKNSEEQTNQKNEDQKVESRELQDKEDENRPGFDEKFLTKDDECFECQQIYRDPVRKDLTMYLHAFSYKFGDLEFKTDYPKWAEEDFIE
ncbi:unnamed protein product [Brachionus calyciflorus]|uniref:Pseudouridine synthase RsuA/RluA-like domain-containing protein n=1 Tax=Brachionus calyciflorus TaxID=104777 RepID=A0A813RJR3_9BILA|nr:unnamed protein product [Brachionus calyciflorus]